MSGTVAGDPTALPTVYRELLVITTAPGVAGPLPPGAQPLGPDAVVLPFASGAAYAVPVEGGRRPADSGRGQVLALSLGARDQSGRLLTQGELARRLGTGAGLDEVASPFAAALIEADRVVLSADLVGLRHVYAVRGAGWAAVATSSTLLARLAGAGLDVASVAGYRYVGHFLGVRTPYAGVTKLASGHRYVVADGTAREEAFDPSPDPRAGQDWTPKAGAEQLTEIVEAYLDHFDRPVFELSGGMDSRIMIAAIPRDRRRGVRSLTLSAPGSGDARVAAEIAAANGFDHQVVDMGELADLDPADAHERVMAAAAHHDSSGNPVNMAALTWSETTVHPSVQLTGQAGEMMRGMYFLEPRSPQVTMAHVERFARWWFTTNDAVPAEALDATFAAGARDQLLDQMRASFFSYGTDWRSARDEFLLQERVQRWGGTTYTGAIYDRIIGSPFFDQRFLRMCRAIPARVKQVNSWAAPVLAELDPDLADLPLTSGLRPRQFPRLLAGYTARTVASALTRKVMQTVRPTNRPPVGAPALAGLALQHWRAHPELLGAVPSTGFVNEAWLDGLLRGEHGAGPTAIGFLANLQAAAVALERPVA